MKVISLATVPHTGTRLLKEFFLNVPEGMPMMQDLEALSRNRTLLHGKDGEGLNPKSNNLVVGHLYPHCLSTIQTLAQFWQPITTLRDPLLTAITYHFRTTDPEMVKKTREGRTDPIFMAYMWTTFLWSFLPMKPFVFAVDLLGDYKARKSALTAALKAADLRDDQKYVKKFAQEWPTVNSSGSYPLKDMYYNNDLAAIEAEIPTQVALLRTLEKDLRPILEQHGYKDLLWWS